MFLAVGALLVLMRAEVNGKGISIPILKFGELEPYREIPCPSLCSTLMKTGIGAALAVLSKYPFGIPIPVDFCQCVLNGLDHSDSDYDYECFRSPEGDVFDHHINASLPNHLMNCKCDFSNNPSTTANIVDKAKLVVGKCGKEKNKNTQRCNPIHCEGTSNENSNSSVKLTAKLTNTKVFIIFRVDTRKENPSAFPILTSLKIDDEEFLTHQGPSKFQNAWKCLDDNNESLVCHLFANSMTPMFDCLSMPNVAATTWNKAGHVIHNILYEAGQCPLSAIKLDELGDQLGITADKFSGGYLLDG